MTTSTASPPATVASGQSSGPASVEDTVDGERRLFDLIGRGRFTLLRFGATPVIDGTPSDLRMLTVVRQPKSPDDVADTGDSLVSAYGATERTLVLVRPDGFVALVSDAGDAMAVSDYFAAIGSAAATSDRTDAHRGPHSP